MADDPRASSPSIIQWRRLLAEGSVIVASILLALAADAWWDGVQEVKAELRLLNSIRQDLVETREDLLLTVSVMTQQVDRFEVYLYADPAVIAELPQDSAQAIVSSLLAVKTYQPYDGALRVADLRLVRDDGLRSQLGRWLGYSEDLLENTPLLHSARVGAMEVAGLDAIQVYLYETPRKTPRETLLARQMRFM